jgi:uncharacterized protein with GYD domain
MSLYFTRAQYSAAAFKGMLTSPSDRGAAAKVLLDAVGVKTRSIHFSVTSGEIVCMMECTAEQMAIVEIVILGSGGFNNVSSLELLSVEEMNTAMSKAGQTAGTYQPPNK